MRCCLGIFQCRFFHGIQFRACKLSERKWCVKKLKALPDTSKNPWRLTVFIIVAALQEHGLSLPSVPQLQREPSALHVQIMGWLVWALWFVPMLLMLYPIYLHQGFCYVEMIKRLNKSRSSSE